MAGTFQGNLQGTPSRPLEYLTSSKAVTASYALESRKLGTADVGGPSQSMYLSGGLPVAISSTIGSKTKPVYVNGGKFTPGDDIPTSKTGSWDSVANWVTLNSGSITGLTGSTTESIANVGGLLAASASWNSASQWVGSNSASISSSVNKVNNLKGITFQTGTFTAKTYHPTGSQQTVNVPSTAAHVGAVSTASFNAYTSSAAAAMDGYLPKTGGTITGSLTITQNLTVQGTTVSIDAQNLNVKDKLILVASGSNTKDAANGAGIAVQTASAGEGGAARIQYESAGNRFTSSVNFAAPGFTGSLQGTASYSTTASYALKATSASWTAEANHAVSASEALHAGNATSASYANSSTSASYANNATTASYALVAESVKDGAGLVVNTASYAINAGTASHVAWTNVGGKPNHYTASFVTGAFTASAFNPTGSNVQIKIPTTTTHISGLNAITASVKQIVAKTASWDGVANTASAAYISASHALATASQAVKEAQSASYWKTEASKSAYQADSYADTASGSMEDARFYSSQAATNATLASTYAVQSSASAQLAAASASAAHISANKAASSASKAANWAVSSSASANQAAYYAVSASASNTTIQQLAANVKQYYDNTTASAAQAATSATAANNASASAKSAQTAANNASASAKTYATNASASASLLYRNLGSATQPVYLTTGGPQLCDPYSSASVLTASYALIAESVKDGAGLIVNTASYALDAAIKYGGHYTPSASGATAQGSTAARTYLKTVSTDGKGHVVGFTTGSETVTDTDRYVATASFASTGSAGANGVKMTLTRAGSDTGTVVATIPVASTTAAGVMTGAQVTNLNGAVASGSLAKNLTSISASLIASAGLAKTAIQPAATASWKAASDWITANSASTHTHSNKAVLDGITAAKTASWEASGTLAKNVTAITASLVASASLAKTAVQSSQTASMTVGSATTATKLAGTSGSTTTPVWINGGVPTACSGTVITDAERNSWVTASNRAAAANDGFTTPVTQSSWSGVTQKTIRPGTFYDFTLYEGEAESIEITLEADTEEVYQAAGIYGSGVSNKLLVWGGLVRIPVNASLEFLNDLGSNFIWAENTADIEEGSTYEFNFIQTEYGGEIYGILTKYSES